MAMDSNDQLYFGGDSEHVYMLDSETKEVTILLTLPSSPINKILINHEYLIILTTHLHLVHMST